MSADWASVGVLPQQAAANLNNAGYWVNGTDFTPAGNVLMSQLINKVGMTYFNELAKGAVYSKYTKDVDANMPLGQYLEQIYIEPAKPQDFKTGAPNGDISPFRRNEPNALVIYNAINYDVQFAVSINIPDVQSAFAVSNGITQYVRSVIQSLYAGADHALDTMFLDLLGEIATVASTNINQVVTVKAITDQPSALAFIKAVGSLVSRWRFRETIFNTMGALQKYNPEDLVLFIRTDWDFDVTMWRATVYHADFVALGIEVDVVRDFDGIRAVTDETPANPLYPVYDAESGERKGWSKTKNNTVADYTGKVISQDPNKSVVALLCSKKHPVVLTQINQLSDDINKRTFTRNYWLTQRKLFAMTPFHNSVIFVVEDKVKPTVVGGTVARTSHIAATVDFTSTENGAYFYGLVAEDATAPTLDTTGAGIACITGNNTITVAGLTAGAKDLYIQVKDYNGNVSEAVKVEIAAFA